MNVTFNTLWDGNLSGNVKYSTRSSFDLGVTTKNITEGFSRDIGISLNYSKSGFELPLFGIDLKNDIEFIFSYTNTRSSTIVFDMANFKEEGTPQDGTTRTSLEPRIKYVLSARVTMSIFYKRSSVSPEGAARIPPTTTNEAGIDVRITIQ
jgi:cell surface protein SprA